MTRGLLAGLAAALLLTACTAASPASSRTDLVVFAASSLNPTFATLGSEFEANHPGVSVKFSFDGSAALVDQLKAGAPADVFAAADKANMDKASTAGLIGATPVQFTTNVLTLIVPKGNPAGITGLDASLGGKKLVICADGVPCGSATRKLAAAVGVTLTPVSEETKVTDVRTKVESGQADAGIVYVSDAKASLGKVETLPIAGADKARNAYLIGTVKAATHATLAAEFVTLVTGERGQQVLKAAGFGG
ncbi:MAG TPA: molybdate ABC transporter substrate-binding protein [Propionicimonas sp.]|uniref:molybdate ABC transporter substrate-binding protein n=1 Tax=Propionicimonas sp. TaxID=1955623 RepID=UPI002F3F5E73